MSSSMRGLRRVRPCGPRGPAAAIDSQRKEKLYRLPSGRTLDTVELGRALGTLLLQTVNTTTESGDDVPAGGARSVEQLSSAARVNLAKVLTLCQHFGLDTAATPRDHSAQLGRGNTASAAAPVVSPSASAVGAVVPPQSLPRSRFDVQLRSVPVASYGNLLRHYFVRVDDLIELHPGNDERICLRGWNRCTDNVLDRLESRHVCCAACLDRILDTVWTGASRFNIITRNCDQCCNEAHQSMVFGTIVSSLGMLLYVTFAVDHSAVWFLVGFYAMVWLGIFVNQLNLEPSEPVAALFRANLNISVDEAVFACSLCDHLAAIAADRVDHPSVDRVGPADPTDRAGSTDRVDRTDRSS